MKILARHLTADLYNCQEASLTDETSLAARLREALAGYELMGNMVEEIGPGHRAVMLLFREGHIGLHLYGELRYVAADIFLCRPEAEPELIFKEIRKIFKPEKTKTTFLKRGDFGKETEIKPKIKTRVAPLRKIHNTGAKVIRILARRNKG